MHQSEKRVFITGAAGFIGFHLAKFLKQRGDFVSGCDLFNDYYDPGLKKRRAEELEKLGIEILECDIRERSTLEWKIEKQHISHLVHFAAQAGVRHSLHHPMSYVDANLEGFVDIVEICRKYPHLKLTYASSSSVYGLNQKIPFSEKDITDTPTNLYGATKKANELIAHAYHHLFGLSATGLRYFTVYGPWGRPDMAYFSFAKAIMEKKPIKVFNQGAMKRDFTYIDDIIKGTAAAIDLESPYAIFNLGNERPEDLTKLIQLLEKYLQKSAILEMAPMQPGDMTITCADISYAREKLGYHPITTLEEGIEKFVHWYQNYIF